MLLQLFIAASDTTSAALSALLGFLPQLSPHVMDKVFLILPLVAHQL
jgi:hypothetical protein